MPVFRGDAAMTIFVHILTHAADFLRRSGWTGMFLRNTPVFALCLVAHIAWAAPVSQSAEAPSSLSETYQDWQVSCVQPSGQNARHCDVSQQQMDNKSRQRVLAIELSPVGDKASGVLLMPFGLALEKGVQIKADNTNLDMSLQYRTCLPQGCIAPVVFDAGTLIALRRVPSLKIIAHAADGSQNPTFSVSLKGFGVALDRAGSLIR